MPEAAAKLEILKEIGDASVTDSSPRGTGILPCQTIREMIRTGEIDATNGILDDQIQPASIDLRLGKYAYPVTTSFLPGRGVSVLQKLKQLDDHYDDYRICLANNNGKGALLEKDRVYVIPLMESIKLKSEHTALANPKSSTGRLDILTRLIVDNATKFDEVTDCYNGQLYVEVSPRSFSVVVKEGTRLNQLRFQRARGESPRPNSDEEWNKLLQEEQIVRTQSEGSQKDDATLNLFRDLMDAGDEEKKRKFSENRWILPFHIDLKGAGKEGDLIGWCSKAGAGRIDMNRRDYDPLDFWEPLRFHKRPSLILEPNRFYILMTEESIGVPPDYAAEMLPYDTRAGEFRVHYAGFFDPGFGWDPSARKVGNSRAVLEVRSHEVPFQLEHGQLVGCLKYERMAATPDKLYGQDCASNYQGQSLKLAKQFLQLK
jgi:dCTP deaminase